MPFLSMEKYESLSDKKKDEIVTSSIMLGQHPKTSDMFTVSNIDRFSGTYILGVQGMGKSGLLENMIYADAFLGKALIVIDPHGDLVDHCIAQLPKTAVPSARVLDMEDEEEPFGINVFSNKEIKTSTDLTQAVDRVMHIFEVLWPDVLNQQNLPTYLRGATIALLSNPGCTLVDMQAFLLDASLRHKLLQNVTEPSVANFWAAYDDIAENERQRRVAALLSRLSSLFMGRSLVRNIVGQRENTIDFRKAIEKEEKIFIKLPLRKLEQDAKLIGTMLISQIYAAVFSFADLPAKKRPGVSLFVDEFQNFTTPDFARLFTEGRKYGVRLALAHQTRSQLPDYLRTATMTAYTKVCFQPTPEDAREMAHLFRTDEEEIREDNIDPHPIDYLLTYGSEHYETRMFTDRYLRPLQAQRKGGQILIETQPGFFDALFNNSAKPKRERVEDPTIYLDQLIYQMMKIKRPLLPIPPQVVIGFSNCAPISFYKEFLSIREQDRNWLLSGELSFPKDLVQETAQGNLRWVREPRNSHDQLYHFLFFLRMTMMHLTYNPVGKKTTRSASDIAHELSQLPRRQAFIRSGTDIGEIHTNNTVKPLGQKELRQREERIRDVTRAYYCTPRSDIEKAQQQSAPNTNTSTQPPPRWEDVDA